MNKLLVFALLISLSYSFEITECVVPDSPNANLQNIAFVAIPGASIEAKQYLEFLNQIKAQATNKLNVYSCFLWYFGSIPQPVDIEYRIQGGIDDLKKRGLPDNYRLFIGGHSLGSVFAQTDYLYKDLKPEGLVFLNGYMLRKYWYGKDHLDIPVKTITIGGEKDGQSTITRLAESWYNTKRNSNPGQHVTVIIEGANHASITTGDMPWTVKKYDLKADIDPAYAKQQAAIALTAYWANDSKTLQTFLLNTSKLL